MVGVFGHGRDFILLIEGNGIVRNQLAQLITTAGYRILTSADHDEAKDILMGDPEAVWALMLCSSEQNEAAAFEAVGAFWAGPVIVARYGLREIAVFLPPHTPPIS